MAKAARRLYQKTKRLEIVRQNAYKKSDAQRHKDLAQMHAQMVTSEEVGLDMALLNPELNDSSKLQCLIENGNDLHQLQAFWTFSYP